MKIYPSIVNTVKFNNSKVSQQKDVDKATFSKQVDYASVPFLGASYYVGFKGKEDNSSLDLAQTMNRLYEAEALKGEKIIPERMKEATDFILEAGNPDKLTLVDVHKNIYDDIRYADSLEEVKKEFPEFDDVLSVEETQTRKKTFIEDVKSGKNNLFSPDEDFALQLLKLYWAEAYSLNDLKKYVDSQVDMYDLLKDLNIPRRHPHYGLRLKLSDSEYNERFIETLKLRQAQRYEKATGGIYIPRGELAPEHKIKIAEGLLYYYAKNPERIYLQSQRQQEFFKNNPEMGNLFREVLFDAWRLGSSKNVKRDMQSFYETKRKQQKRKELEDKRLAKISGKNETKTVKEITMPSDKALADVKNLGAKQRVLLQEFWDTHPDAKRLFSRSLVCAWDRVKKIKEAESQCVVLDEGLPAYPKKIADKMRAWTVSKGYDPDTIMLHMSVTMGTFNQNLANKAMSARLVTQYFEENPLMSDIYADSLVYALGELKQYLHVNRSNVGDSAIHKMEGAVKGKKCLYVNDVVNLYLEIIQMLLRANDIEGVVKLVVSLETAYDAVIKWRKSNGQAVPN